MDIASSATVFHEEMGYDILDTMVMEDVAWGVGHWLHPPADVRVDGHHLLVTARKGSDLWRTTAYGMVRDSGHALLADLPQGSAVEITFVLDFGEQFDQAGVLMRASERSWIKAGVEIADGAAQVGAVVTREFSDWSVAPVPEWVGREVTVRASRRGDAVTIRARCQGPWQLVRVAPLDSGTHWQAGPYCCSPSRGGLEVRFTRFASGPADESVHP